MGYILFCGIVAASVDVERLWSSAGNIMNDKRNRLMENHLACELFIKFNRHISTLPQPRARDLKINVSSLLDNTKPFIAAETIVDLQAQDQQFQDEAEDEENEKAEDEDEESSYDDPELAILAEEFDEEAKATEADFSWSRSSASKHFGNALEEIMNAEQPRQRNPNSGIFHSLSLIDAQN